MFHICNTPNIRISMQKLMPFHLAIPVSYLHKTRTFYRELIECKEGRSDTQWVDFDFYAHQLVIHMAESRTKSKVGTANEVDGHSLPNSHFGVVLKWDDWHRLVHRLKATNIKLGIEPIYDSKANQESRRLCFPTIQVAMR
ncbi:MAG: extradiol dioxygenase family protein [Saprospiraceae bacterium]